MILTEIRIREGRWHGLLEGAGAAPALALWQGGRRLDDLTPTPAGGEGRFHIEAPIPPEEIAEGVRTFLIRDEATGEVLAHFSLILGGALEADLRGEVDLLRAELDMLKAAFRRHCVATGAEG